MGGLEGQESEQSDEEVADGAVERGDEGVEAGSPRAGEDVGEAPADRVEAVGALDGDGRVHEPRAAEQADQEEGDDQPHRDGQQEQQPHQHRAEVGDVQRQRAEHQQRAEDEDHAQRD